MVAKALIWSGGWTVFSERTRLLRNLHGNDAHVATAIERKPRHPTNHENLAMLLADVRDDLIRIAVSDSLPRNMLASPAETFRSRVLDPPPPGNRMDVMEAILAAVVLEHLCERPALSHTGRRLVS